MPQMQQKKRPVHPPQKQPVQPGLEHKMRPKPKCKPRASAGKPKLARRVALITGGDSGIGRAVALAFAAEGSDVSITYLNEHRDAKDTLRMIEKLGRRAMAIAGDIGDESFCREAVKQTVRKFGRLDILVNNAAEQHPQKNLEDITAAQLERTFRTNIFA